MNMYDALLVVAALAVLALYFWLATLQSKQS